MEKKCATQGALLFSLSHGRRVHLRV